MPEEKLENRKGNQRTLRVAPFWEWIVAAFGLIVVLGAIGLSIYRAVREESTPPAISIRVNSISATQDGFLVQFSVINTGNQTAAGLNVVGELSDTFEVVESSSTTLTYAPANSEREAGLFFSRNPNEFQLNIRPSGYSVP